MVGCRRWLVKGLVVDRFILFGASSISDLHPTLGSLLIDDEDVFLLLALRHVELIQSVDRVGSSRLFFGCQLILFRIHEAMVLTDRICKLFDGTSQAQRRNGAVDGLIPASEFLAYWRNVVGDRAKLLRPDFSQKILRVQSSQAFPQSRQVVHPVDELLLLRVLNSHLRLTLQH